MDKKGISPIEIVKFEEHVEVIPTRILEDVLITIIEELEKRNNQSFNVYD